MAQSRIMGENTRSEWYFRYEAGIWSRNLVIVNEAYRFIEKLSGLSAFR